MNNILQPLVSVLIGSKDRPHDVIRCLKSVVDQTYDHIEIMVLDDNSRENLCDRINAAIHDVRIKCIRSDITLGVAGGRNKLIKEATGDILITLDDDAEFRYKNSIEKVVQLFNSSSDIGIISFKIIDIIDNRENRIRVPFRRILIKINPEIVNISQNVSYFLGGGHAIRNSVFKECGLYQDNLIFGGEELDLAYRVLEAGYSIFYMPDVVVYHYPNPRYYDPIVKIAKDKYSYYSIRNKIWINYKYLPMKYFIVNSLFWCIIMVTSSVLHGGFLNVIKGITDGYYGIKKLKRNPISKKTIEYLRNNYGRLFY